MQSLFSTIGKSLGKRILLISLMGLLVLSSVFVFTNQPALADRPSQAQDKIDRAYNMNESAGLREEDRQEAYEEATEAVGSDPKEGLEEIYEEDLKAYKQDNADNGGLLGGAKNLVDKVTGQE